jgi:hypothetical protein
MTLIDGNVELHKDYYRIARVIHLDPTSSVVALVFNVLHGNGFRW